MVTAGVTHWMTYVAAFIKSSPHTFWWAAFCLFKIEITSLQFTQLIVIFTTHNGFLLYYIHLVYDIGNGAATFRKSWPGAAFTWNVTATSRLSHVEWLWCPAAIIKVIVQHILLINILINQNFDLLPKWLFHFNVCCRFMLWWKPVIINMASASVLMPWAWLCYCYLTMLKYASFWHLSSDCWKYQWHHQHELISAHANTNLCLFSEAIVKSTSCR